MEIGRTDILLEVSPISMRLELPHEVYLKKVIHIFGCLNFHKKMRFVFGCVYPRMTPNLFKEYD